MTFADDRLADVAAELDAWNTAAARDLLESVRCAPERHAWVLRCASGPVTSVVIRLAGQMPGHDFSQDVEWAVSAAQRRREVLANRSGGVDAGLADLSLRLLNWVDSQIGTWPEPEWSAAVRRRAKGFIDARNRGVRRGEMRRSSPEREEPLPLVSEAGWLLRHPADHYFRQARATAIDPWLCAHLDEWISAFAPSYRALAGLDYNAEEHGADLVVELRLCDPVEHDRRRPTPAVVVATHRGSAAVGSQLRLRQVADPDAPFNGTLVSLLPGESWLVCASQCSDGTLIPGDGTRRTT